jgi:hypothetical protein
MEEGTVGAHDSLQNGIGYRVKVPAAQTVSMAGGIRWTDTVNVRTGWNMMGRFRIRLQRQEFFRFRAE